jgi:hypothetical protein
MAVPFGRPVAQVLDCLARGRAVEPPEAEVASDDPQDLRVHDMRRSLIGIEREALARA